MRLDIIVQKAAQHVLVSRLIVSNSLMRMENTQLVLLIASAAVKQVIIAQTDLQHQEDNPEVIIQRRLRVLHLHRPKVLRLVLPKVLLHLHQRVLLNLQAKPL